VVPEYSTAVPFTVPVYPWAPSSPHLNVVLQPSWLMTQMSSPHSPATLQVPAMLTHSPPVLPLLLLLPLLDDDEPG
jgi:hypothetical protein